MLKLVWLIMTLMTLHMASYVLAEETITSFLAKLLDPDPNVRIKSLNSLQKHRMELQKIILHDLADALLNSTGILKRGDKAATFLNAAGIMRLEEASDICLRFIEAKFDDYDPLRSREKIPLEDAYPAVKCLIQTNPKVSHILGFAVETSSPLARQLATIVLLRAVDNNRELLKVMFNSLILDVRNKANVQKIVFLLDQPDVLSKIQE